MSLKKKWGDGRIDVKQQYNIYKDFIKRIGKKLDYGIASFLLKLPVPMSYEVWQYLHLVKGDW